MYGICRFLSGAGLLLAALAVQGADLDEIPLIGDLLDPVPGTQVAGQSPEIRLYPMGRLAQISGRLRMRQSVKARGLVLRALYQPPVLADEVVEVPLRLFTDIRQRLIADPSTTLLFWCEQRDCGPSSLWANAVFEDRQLYGPDNQQAYALFFSAEQQALLAMYAVTRGNGRNYLQLDWMPEATLDPPRLLPTADTLLRQLQEQSALHWPELAGPPDADWLETLLGMLRLERMMRVVIAGPQAAAWRQALIDQGIRAPRMELGSADVPGLEIRRIE